MSGATILNKCIDAINRTTPKQILTDLALQGVSLDASQ
jgi:hypothetical protein